VFENPELIWNVESRERVCTTIATMKRDQYLNQVDATIRPQIQSW
jgi:hypothetical protein